MKTKTSTKIALIFSVFTFFVVSFLIIFINVISYYTWHKSEENEYSNGLEHYNSELKKFIDEQIESIEYEILFLIFITIFTYFMGKYIFSKMIFSKINKISEKLKNLDIEKSENLDIIGNDEEEINIIVKSINDFIKIISQNRENLKNFNSQVAHEFKTPLMVISSEIELLNIQNKKTNKYKKIENQVDKLNKLLDNFLLLTKIENGKNIKKEEINLYKIFNKNIKILEQKYEEKNIIINLDIDKKETIFTNKSFFEIIIKNLLDNAFKYNKNGGEIKISFKKNLLKIKDSGIGIKNKEKIWDNLYRENISEKGYGVGLNLVKKVVQVLGFKISLKSELGEGSEFIIKI